MVRLSITRAYLTMYTLKSDLVVSYCTLDIDIWRQYSVSSFRCMASFHERNTCENVLLRYVHSTIQLNQLSNIGSPPKSSNNRAIPSNE